MNHTIVLKVGSFPAVALVGAPAGFEAQIRSEFGSQNVITSGGFEEADALVWVRFASVHPPASAIYVGRNACFAGGVAYFAEGDVWARLDFRRLFDPASAPVIESDFKFDAVRLMGYYVEPLMKLRALLRGNVFVHSSALVMGATAFLFCAWGNTGKTNLVLEMSLRGKGFILADDWSLLLAEGGLAAYPRPVNIMNYNFDLFPELKLQLGWGKRCMIGADWIFRRSRGHLMRLGPVGLRAADLAGRLLDALSNARLPLRDATARAGSFPVRAILDVQKVAADALPKITRSERSDLIEQAVGCFLYENRKLMDRLAEARFAEPNAGVVEESEIANLYRRCLFEALKVIPDDRFFRLSIPARPSRATVGELADLVMSSVAPV